jgi:hypothetical protein
VRFGSAPVRRSATAMDSGPARVGYGAELTKSSATTARNQATTLEQRPTTQHTGQYFMPASSLAAGFDARCAGLEAAVDHSVAALGKLRRAATTRDQLMLRTIGSDINQLRESLASVTAELQPRLERLSAAEPIPHGSLRYIGSSPGRPKPSHQRVKAASALQAAWRRRRHLSHCRSAFRDLDYCPPSLRRAFLRGERLPYAQHRAGDANPIANDASPAGGAHVAQPEGATPLSGFALAPFASAAPPSGGGHFMSIL